MRTHVAPQVEYRNASTATWPRRLLSDDGAAISIGEREVWGERAGGNQPHHRTPDEVVACEPGAEDEAPSRPGGRGQDRDKRDDRGEHGDKRKQEEVRTLAHAPPRVETLESAPRSAILYEVSPNPDHDLGVSR